MKDAEEMRERYERCGKSVEEMQKKVQKINVKRCRKRCRKRYGKSVESAKKRCSKKEQDLAKTTTYLNE